MRWILVLGEREMISGEAKLMAVLILQGRIQRYTTWIGFMYLSSTVSRKIRLPFVLALYWRSRWEGFRISEDTRNLTIPNFWSASLQYWWSCWWTCPNISDREERNAGGFFTTALARISSMFLLHVIFDFVNDRVEVWVADIIRLVKTSRLHDHTAVLFGVRVLGFELFCEVMLSEVSFNKADPSLNSTDSVEPFPLNSFKIGTLEILPRNWLRAL